MSSIFSTVGGAAVFSSASGGKIYAYNNISEVAPAQVAPANPSRRRIRFHNPGLSNIYIAPASVQNTGSDATLTPSNGSLGGCFILYADGGTLDIEGECQKAWQAFAVTGAGSANPLTVMDTNV